MTLAKLLKMCILLNIIATTFLCPAAKLWAEENYQPPKRILALFSFKPGLPFTFHIEQSLRLALASDSSYPLILDVEHADQSRFPDEKYRSKIVDLYRYKYDKEKIDLVLAVGNESSDLILEYGAELFGDIPVVFVTTKSKKLSQSPLKPGMVSLVWGVDLKRNGKIIQHVLPDTQNLFVISGSSLIDQTLKNMAMESLSELDVPFTIHYLDDLSLQELLLKIAQLPEHSAILFLTFFSDVNGQSFVPRDLVSKISATANASVFGILVPYLGRGIVGGNLLSAEYQGEKYAEIAKKILAGESLKNLKVMGSENQMMFDWRQLKRWSIDQSLLPAGSIVRYRETSIWEDHKLEVAGITAALFILTFALIALIIQNGRRRRAELESQKLRDERDHISRVLSMGEIAASLAHELNQPLSAIRTYAQAAQRFLDKSPAEPDEAAKSLSGIVTANRRAEEVIKRIRMALKKETTAQTSLDVKDITRGVNVLVRRKAQEQNVSLSFEVAADLPPVSGDLIQLQQVLFNLIINAIEAMPDAADSLHQIRVQVLREKNNAVKIVVQDNGVGVDEKKINSLFDAFYTTKTEGMGMGLSISRSIIEEHGGQFRVRRNYDKGTSFSFTIPVYKGENK